MRVWNYLIIPMELLKSQKKNNVIVLSQLVYMKKAFKELNPSNAYLSNKLNLSRSTIQRCLTELSQEHYIIIKIKSNYQRRITITDKAFKAYGIIDTKSKEKALISKKSSVLQEFLVS